MAKPCAVPLCLAMRIKDSYLCAGHDADARNKRKFAGAEPAPKPLRRKGSRTSGIAVGTSLTFADQCKFAGLPIPVAEFHFHPIRRWRFDWALKDERLALEVEGGIFKDGGGRHNRGNGFRNDLEKYAEAAILGWRVIRVLPEWIESGQALTYVERALTGSNK